MTSPRDLLSEALGWERQAEQCRAKAAELRDRAMAGLLNGAEDSDAVLSAKDEMSVLEGEIADAT